MFSRSRFPPKGSDESMSHSDMVRGLVPSMVRWKGWAMLSWWEGWFLPCQMWVMVHSDVTVGLVATWSYISSECHSWNGGTWSVTRKAQSGTWGPFWCDCRIGSYMIRYKCWMPFLEWRNLVSYQEYLAWCWDARCHSLGEWRHLVSYQESSVWDWEPF